VTLAPSSTTSPANSLPRTVRRGLAQAAEQPDHRRRRGAEAADSHTTEDDRVIPNDDFASPAGDGTYLVTQPVVQHNVGAVHRRGPDPYQQLVVARRRRVDIDDVNDVGRSVDRVDRGSHASHRSERRAGICGLEPAPAQ
jgi:hypothetical protein